MAGGRPKGSCKCKTKRHAAASTTALLGLIVSLTVLLVSSAGAAPPGYPPSPEQPGLEHPPFGDDGAPLHAPATENGAIVPGHYIVVLEDSVARPVAVAEAQTESHDGELGFVYRYGMKGYSAELSHQAVEELRENPKVRYVTPDRVVTVQSQTIPTGIERAYATKNPSADIDGEDNPRVDADVAVIDTGIDYTHPDLNVVERTNCIAAGEEEGFESCVDESGVDGNGHGTHVAGTVGALDNGEGVVGVAPGARLWAVKVLTDEGWGYESWIVGGVDWVTAHSSQIEVANMSLTCACPMPALDTAIDESLEAGVVYAVAAGNDRADASEYSPASNPDVITVSALADYDGKAGGKGSPTCQNWGPDDTLAGFSNYGKGVDVAAPGACIASTWPGGGYETISGTSMASPHVAGAAALLAAQANPSSKEDVEAIREELEEEGNYEWTDNSGDGAKEPLLDLGEWTALTEGFDLVTGSEPEATLHGRVNPRGAETSYHFEYDTAPYEAGKEGHGTSIPVPDAAAGSGSKYVPVSKTATGLSNQATYHYRLVAENSNGTFYGTDRELATTPPAAQSGEADEVNANDATLHGVVNPEGAETTFSFELGPSTSYGRTAAAATDAGSESSASGTEDVDVSAIVGGLAPNRIYHFRMVAENLAGTSYGEDQMLLTGPSEWVAQPTPVPGGQRNALGGISCVSRSSCMAVGNDGKLGSTIEGIAVRWDGEEWSLEPMPEIEGEELTEPQSVSCVSEKWCAAVGTTLGSALDSEYTALAEHWNGKEWIVDSLPLPAETIESELYDVSCTSASACTAVGHYMKEDETRYLLVERWNGAKWTRQTPPALGKEHFSEALQSVSCVDASYCVAVGWYEDFSKTGGGAELWNGTSWTKISGLSESLLRHVSCPLRNACTVIGLMPGNHTEAVHWDGKGWTAPESIPIAPGTSETLLRGFRDMSCPEADSCTLSGGSVAGGYTAPFAARWEDDEWSVQSTAEPAQEEGLSYPQAELSGVSCPSPSWCVAAGTYRSQSLEAFSGMVETYEAPGPASITKPATHVGSSRATLNASVDPEGLETTYRFEYGEDKAYGSEFPASPKAIGSGEEGVEVSEVLKGLKPQSTYHFRVAATNSEGTTYGEDRSFTTLAVTPAFSFSVGKSGSGEGQLSEPRGIALDGEDQIWAADSGNSRISKFDQAGEALASYGAQGSALGQFGSASPGAIAVDSAGNVWAADTANNRLQELDSEGKFLKAIGWGVKGEGTGLQVCESSCAAGVAGSGSGQLDHPQGIALDAQGDVWVADSANDRLQQFSPAGEYLGQLETTGSATDLAFDAEGKIWVAEPARNRISRYSTEGELLAEAGSEGTGNGQFKAPSGLGVEEGNIWVADTENNRVQVLNPQGEYLASFGATGSGEGQFSHPRDVAFDSEGDAWVSDSKNNRIQHWIYPEPPKAITEAATEVERKSATLHGTLNPEAAATSYWFEYGKTSDYGSQTPTTPASVPPGTSNVAASQTPTELSEGTTYHFRLVASNAGGIAYGEDETLKTLAIPKATTEAASEVKETSTRLNGTVNPGGFSTNYYFEWGKDTGYGNKTAVESAGSGNSGVATSAVLSGLEAGATYHFRLIVEGGGFTAKGADKEFKTLKAPKATTEAATEVKENSATLNGKVNPEGNEASYWFEWAKGEGFPPPSGEVQSAGSGAADVAVNEKISGLKAGTTYNFRVVAENGAGTKVYGEIKQFKTTRAPKATTEAATEVKETSANLNGTVNPEGSATSYYFEWGKSTAYGSKTEVKSAGSGTASVAVSSALSGLEGGTTYHFRLVAEGASTVKGKDREFTTSKPPKATTEAAKEVRATRATLRGTVNPNGKATTYWFECGKTTSYGTNVPTSPKEAGSGTSNVAVSETYGGLEPANTYHCRLAAENSAKETAKGEDVSFTTEAAGSGTFLLRMGTTNPFDASASSLADFGANFSALGWATSGTPKGEDTSTGWKSPATSSKTSGAYYTPAFSDLGWGLAGAVTMAEAPTEGASFSLWVDMPTPGSTKAGYELKTKYVSAGTFSLTLSKWVGGTQTELASKASYSLAKGNSLALVDQGPAVSAWVNTGSGFGEVLSASDSTFESGQIGISAAGSATRLTNFKAAALRSPRTTTEAASEVKATSATLNGVVNPNGHESSYWFEYGTSTAYGSKTEVNPVLAGDELEDVAVSEALSGLKASTTYHYRVVAESEAGKNYGIDKTFTTPAS